MIVMPMAGLSSRFTARGYALPKFMLELHGRPVFDFALARFAHAFESDRFLFIARSELGVADFIRQRLGALGVKTYHIVGIEAPTRGQAETVAIGAAGAGVAEDESLAIFNIDTFVAGEPRDYGRDFPLASGVLEVIRSAGSNWSFVEPDAPGSRVVRRTTEKLPISDLCCTGLYWFRRLDHFLHALERERSAPQSGELYVAPLYNHLIASGRRVEFDLIERDRVALCGVPAEYEALVPLKRPTGAALFDLRDRLEARAGSAG